VKGTWVYKLDPNNPDQKIILKAAELLKSGQVVGFPTETVYGIGADALNPEAVDRIFKAKGRPSDNPLILHISELDELAPLVKDIPPRALKLAEEFWPGPLTMIMEKAGKVPDVVTAGLNTVGIRMPDNLTALKLIRAAGVPVAAPSGNLSGKPSPTKTEHLICDMAGRIPLILGGGETRVGIESTVIDLTLKTPMVLRPGGITLEELRIVLGRVDVDPAVERGKDFVPKSPGQKYTHYSPDADVTVIEGDIKNQLHRIKELVDEAGANGIKAGVLSTTQTHRFYSGVPVICLGDREHPASISARLFSALREMDELGVEVIFAEGISESGLGLAVMNRLRKAAGFNILRV
jgi:L-threonylcarbamoyladenylate synthase